MKVIDVTEFYSERGGGVRSYLEAKEHILCQLGHGSLLLAPGPPALSTPHVRRLGGPTMPYDPTYHFLWRPDKIRALVAAENPDVLEVHSPYVAAVGALMSSPRSFGIRTFFWHSDFIDTYKRVLGAMRPRFAPLLENVAVPLWAWVRRIADGCAATFCASDWQARKLGEHGVKATRIPFGVDKDVFRVVSEPTHARSFVAVGRLAVEKQWDVVIDAFGRIVERHPDASLTVFGDGPERARLERQATGMNVRFSGFDRDRKALARALGQSRALLHGCPHETFGIAVAEAVACGTPVVVPDEGGAAELAHETHSEKYRAGDANACAAAIERLLARDEATLRTAAADAARSILSVREHFDRLLDHYRSLR
jgi:alpha-1,6-mannosyltransferase